MKHAILSFLLLTSPLAAFAGMEEHSGHMVLLAEELKWGPAPAALPAGAQLAVLDGNPANVEPFTLRLKFPANYKVANHYHSSTEMLTVLKGALRLGVQTVEGAKEFPILRAGDFVKVQAASPHWAATDEETIIQISGTGPFDLVYVDGAAGRKN